FTEDLKKSNIIFVLGGPGSGKGTQCGKLAQKYGFMHVSVEDLIQNEAASGRSKTIRDITESGEFISGDIVTELLKEAILANMENSKGFLIDGYPQDIQQGEQFENEIGEPSLILCMDCSSKTMSNHLMQKSQCLEDNVEAIMKCIEAYYKTAETLIAYYENRIPLFKINAEGTPEEVFLEICTSVNTFLKKE
ncbi:adenylate kinase isoenzyme 5, partial [Protobothrops mucrosquamatus]|uniref:adenylate kinase isoenzyme 5 n=1 Tax=Protobothrops mucrosquamatus TaxID=103944 RepID=UPI000775A9A9